VIQTTFPANLPITPNVTIFFNPDESA
jgi:hypothetical protein